MKALVELADDDTELRIVGVAGEQVPNELRRREQLERIAAAAAATLQGQRSECREMQRQQVVALLDSTDLSVAEIASQVGVSRGQVRVWAP